VCLSPAALSGATRRWHAPTLPPPTRPSQRWHGRARPVPAPIGRHYRLVTGAICGRSGPTCSQLGALAWHLGSPAPLPPQPLQAARRWGGRGAAGGLVTTRPEPLFRGGRGGNLQRGAARLGARQYTAPPRVGGCGPAGVLAAGPPLGVRLAWWPAAAGQQRRRRVTPLTPLRSVSA